MTTTKAPAASFGGPEPFDFFPPLVRQFGRATSRWGREQSQQEELPPENVDAAHRTLLQATARHRNSSPVGRWSSFGTFLASIPTLKNALSLLREEMPGEESARPFLEEMHGLLQQPSPTEPQLLAQEHLEKTMQALGKAWQAGESYEEVLSHLTPLLVARDGVFEAGDIAGLRAYVALFDQLRSPKPKLSGGACEALESVYENVEIETVHLHGYLMLAESSSGAS